MSTPREFYDEAYLEKEALELDKFTGESLYEFTYDKPYLAQHLTVFAKRSERFALALAKAKERLAHNRTKMLCEGKLHNSAYLRSQHVYDHITREVDEAIKDADAKRQKEVNSQLPNANAILEVHGLAKQLNEAEAREKEKDATIQELLMRLEKLEASR